MKVVLVEMHTITLGVVASPYVVWTGVCGSSVLAYGFMLGIAAIAHGRLYAHTMVNALSLRLPYSYLPLVGVVLCLRAYSGMSVSLIKASNKFKMTFIMNSFKS